MTGLGFPRHLCRISPIGPPDSSTPSQLNNLPMVLPRAVQAAKFKARAVGPQRGMDPSVRPPLLEQVSNRRKVNQAQLAFIVKNAPPMRVAEEPGLDVPARAQNLQQRRRILQRPALGAAQVG